MNYFANFLESMKTDTNSALLESLKNGYTSIFESNYMGSVEEERELSNGFIEKLKNSIINKTREDLTPPNKLFETLDGLTVKVLRAMLNNPKTPDGDKGVFQSRLNRIENKYRRAGIPVPKTEEPTA